MFRSLSLFFVLAILPQLALAETPDSAGFIYGMVTERSGESHTGFLRWESEEAFWDDSFDSRQVGSAWTELIDFKALHKEQQQAYFESHGLLDRLTYALHNKNPDDDISRLFLVRFGDLERILIDDDEDITIVLNNGAEYEVAGYANDVRSDILVYGNDDGPQQLDWDDLAEIRFFQAPDDAIPYAQRLSGTVTTTRGEFAGFIMWDMSECTSIDVLNSDEEDVVMGDIASISRTSRGKSEVTFDDGRVAVLTGSNDVDNGNRGIGVDSPQLGRIYISWKRVKNVNFANDLGSGPKRSDFGENKVLRGSVTDQSGQTLSGRFIYDLDEAYTHDIFTGNSRDVLYEIPFALIATIEPLADNACRVILHDGTELTLQDDQDTGDDNGGLLVFDAAEESVQRVPWYQIAKIQFAP